MYSPEFPLITIGRYGFKILIPQADCDSDGFSINFQTSIYFNTYYINECSFRILGFGLALFKFEKVKQMPRARKLHKGK